MKIGIKTRELIVKQVSGLLADYEEALSEAYLRAEKDFAISLGVKIAPNGNGAKVETQISFVKEKIKDTASGTVSEVQVDLFEKFKACPINGGQYVPLGRCHNSCPLRDEAIVVWGDQMPSAMEEIPSPAEGLFVQFRSCSAWADEDHHEVIDDLLADCDEDIVMDEFLGRFVKRVTLGGPSIDTGVGYDEIERQQ